MKEFESKFKILKMHEIAFEAERAKFERLKELREKEIAYYTRHLANDIAIDFTKRFGATYHAILRMEYKFVKLYPDGADLDDCKYTECFECGDWLVRVKAPTKEQVKFDGNEIAEWFKKFKDFFKEMEV